MLSDRRLAAERTILERFFPAMRLQGIGTDKAGVVGSLTTNSRRSYTVWLPLGSFPDSKPALYVIRPKPLLASDGQPMTSYGASGIMHLLAPDAHGHTQICHFHPQYWKPDITLYRVLLKGRIWLEAYEGHLRTGEPINAFLRDQDAPLPPPQRRIR